MKKLHSCILIFLFSGISLLTAKSNSPAQQSTWHQADFKESVETLNKYFALAKESYGWDREERRLYCEKLYEGAVHHKVDSIGHYASLMIGLSYMDEDSTYQALFYLNKSLDFSYDDVSESDAYNSLGNVHHTGRDYKTAIEYYHKAWEAAKRVGNGMEAYSIGNLSQVYSQLGDYENALKYVKLSNSFSKTLETPEKEYNCVYDYANFIEYYNELNLPDSSMLYVIQALPEITAIDTLDDIRYQEAIFAAYAGITRTYIQIKQQREAAKFLKLAEEHYSTFFRQELTILKAEYAFLNRDYDKTLQILSEVDLSEENFPTREKILRMRVKAYSSMGDWQAVIKTKDEIIAMQKAKTQDEHVKYAAFVNIKHETYQKNEEINSLKLNQELKDLTIQNQRYLFLIALAMFLMVGLTAFLQWRKNRYREKLGKKLEQQVDEKTKHLQKVNNELRMLNFIASHDIKEPIRNIGNFVSLIQRRMPEDLRTNFKLYFDTISGSVKQLYELIEDMSKYLSFSQEENISFAEVDLNDVVGKLRNSSEIFFENENGKIETKGTMPTIQSNASMMHLILSNLIKNGLKYNESEQPTVRIEHKAKGAMNEIRVIDNGIGIDPAYHEKIFETFKRLHTRDEYTGSGMGLSIVKLLIEKLGGSVAVESEVGKGTSFVLSFPKLS